MLLLKQRHAAVVVRAQVALHALKHGEGLHEGARGGGYGCGVGVFGEKKLDRIESADYFFPDAAAACRFQSHIKQSGKGKLPWRYRWPDEVRDDVLARLLALNAARAELERLTGLSSGTSGSGSTASPDGSDSDADGPAPSKAKRAKKATKRESKKSAPRPMFDE